MLSDAAAIRLCINFVVSQLRCKLIILQAHQTGVKIPEMTGSKPRLALKQ